MAKFRGVERQCKICDATFRAPPSRALTAEYCSIACAAIGRGQRQRNRLTLQCRNCSEDFDVPASHADRRIYCSSGCKHTAEEYLKALHHRAVGDRNNQWKGGRVDHSDGYRYVLAVDHPYTANGYVLEHRIVMERWLRQNKPDSPFLIRLGQNLYLKPGCHVHHKDEDRRNNRIENLECLEAADHRKIHADMRRQRRADDKE